jgi:two-component system sensor histidine kinase YesM
MRLRGTIHFEASRGLSDLWDFVLKKINNIKVRNKLILLYLLAVFLPIVVTNAIFYQSISESLYMKQNDDMKSSVERIQEHLNKKIQECLLIANVIYTDNKVNEALEKEYSNVNAYLEEFRSNFVNTVSKYVNVYPQIAGITVYAKNPTIVSGAEFMNAGERIMKTNWYQALYNSEENTILYPYINSEGTQTISLLKKMNYFAFHKRVQKFLKLDIRYVAIYKELKNEKLEGDVYLLDSQKRIIASTNPQFSFLSNKLSGYPTINDVQLKQDERVVNEQFFSSDYLNGWSVEVHHPKYQLLDELKHSRRFIIYLSLINLVIPTLIILLLSQSFISRIRSLSINMRKLRDQRFEIIKKDSGEDELGQLTRNYNVMVNRMESLINEVYVTGLRNKSLEIESKQAQLHALQSQIKPHFLFNTMETIRMRSLLKQEN